MSIQQTIPDFCFYFPYYEDSGVPVLFYRMANIIAASYPSAQITVIDYANGAMARHLLPLQNIQVLFFKDGETIVPPENAILILQSDVPYYWPIELKPSDKTRLFFWNLHPRNFIPSLLPFPYLRELPFNYYNLYKGLKILYPKIINNLQGYVKLLIDNSALSFMDQTNKDYTEKYLFLKSEADSYLPVFVNVQDDKSLKNNVSDPIKFCWVGRICDFKTYILTYLCQQLCQASEKITRKIEFYIIGDGPLMDYAKTNIPKTDNFKPIYKGAIPHNELHSFLIKNIDVVAAMGSSALEAAALRIPTIGLDFSYSEIKIPYKFRWLYDAVNFDLGHEISDNDIDTESTSLLQMLNELINNYDMVANRTYLHYKHNHSPEIVVEKFIEMAGQSTLYYEMINKEYFRKSALLKLYNKIRGLES